MQRELPLLARQSLARRPAARARRQAFTPPASLPRTQRSFVHPKERPTCATDCYPTGFSNNSLRRIPIRCPYHCAKVHSVFTAYTVEFLRLIELASSK